MTTGAPLAAARLRRGHVLGMLWMLGAAAALVGPALAHGSSLGPIDWLSQYGLSARHGVVVNNRQTFDQVAELIPWSTLGWSQVHHGHLPLWNAYSGLGMPLAFNWQSASFSLPALLGYLLPLHLAYSVQVLAALVLAGTGVYAFGTVAGLGPLGCATAATVYELSGPFVGWLGWPVAWVMAWAGWVFAAAALVLRGRHRARGVILMAIVVAAAVYAGQPDTLVLLALATLVFVGASLSLRARARGGPGPVVRPLLDVAVATAVGAALSAPLWLPGIQLARMSVRSGKGQSQILSARDAVHFLVQGFDGLPVIGSRWFGPGFYVRTAAYIGVTGLVLAAVGVWVAVRRRASLPDATAVLVVAACATATVFVPVVLSALQALPAVGAVTWNRALLVLGFALAVLAGVGADAVSRRWHEPPVRRATAGAAGALGVALGLVWLWGRGHLPLAEAAVRSHSFLWPALSTAGALALLGVARLAPFRWVPKRVAGMVRARRGAWVAGGLLVIETALLVGAGAPLLTSSPTPLTPTPAERTLARTVGTGLVGLGSNACFSTDQLGVVPDVNLVLGVSELAVYDPVLPQAYYASWLGATGLTGAPQVRPAVPFSLFCPAVTSTTIARRYGVAFVLEPAGAPGPRGTTRVRAVGDEVLYRVPGAARATLVRATSSRSWPGVDAPGTPVPRTGPDPATWVLHTDAASPSVLRLRLTAVPGWHATVDGHPAPLARFAGVMLQLRVPPGRHSVVVSYAPAAFGVGLGAALGGALALLAAAAAGFLGRRRARAAPATLRAAP